MRELGREEGGGKFGGVEGGGKLGDTEGGVRLRETEGQRKGRTGRRKARGREEQGDGRPQQRKARQTALLMPPTSDWMETKRLYPTLGRSRPSSLYLETPHLACEELRLCSRLNPFFFLPAHLQTPAISL